MKKELVKNILIDLIKTGKPVSVKTPDDTINFYVDPGTQRGCYLASFMTTEQFWLEEGISDRDYTYVFLVNRKNHKSLFSWFYEDKLEQTKEKVGELGVSYLFSEMKDTQLATINLSEKDFDSCKLTFDEKDHCILEFKNIIISTY